MTKTLDTSHPKKSREPLDKLFHVLFTETMCLRLNSYANRRGISKGRLVRIAVEEHLHKIENPQSLDHETPQSIDADLQTPQSFPTELPRTTKSPHI